MKIYLVRHGRPKPESEDPLKGLSEEGRDEVSKIASYANRHLNIKVEQIYHSGKARA
ncbi:MAG: phosphohistidine phosphatase SixA, partial [candidate division Zixibacteria bacterium]|nr:phosphohistidine phosphatase SixA [candidate division Zixibacteria bacterium]